MPVITRIRNLIREHGLLSIGTKLVALTIDRFFEHRYGIDTLQSRSIESLSIESQHVPHGRDYESSRILPLHRLMKTMKSLVPADSALVDCGCGKGKVLLAAAKSGITKIRGLEFAKELCEIACRNWDRFQRRTQSTAECQILWIDVLEYEIAPNDCMFFLFNPFDVIVLEELLRNIDRSLAEHPRNIVIAVAFLSPEYEEVFKKFPRFSNRRDEIYWACRFSLFTSG